MVIRKAEKTDIPHVLRLYARVLDGGNTVQTETAEQIYDKMKSYPDYHIYVAELDGNIVGTFALAIMDNMAHMGAKSGLIEDVAVSDSFQGKGIGTQMMKYAVEICKENACYKVCLSSNIKREMAHKFYRKLGFKIHGYSFLTEL